MDPASILAELDELPASRRVDRLRAAGDVAALIDAIAAHLDGAALSDLAQATRGAETLVATADLLGIAASRARARRALAQVLAYSNQFDRALEAIGEAIELARGEGDDVATGQARMVRLHALARLGRLDEAIAEGEAAHAAFSRHDRLDLSMRADINMGVVHRMRGDPTHALDRFERARACATEPLIIAQLASNRAEALLDLDRFADAEASFIEALEGFRSLGRTRAEAIVEGNLGDLLGRQGRFAEAIERFDRAERIFADHQAPGDRARLAAEHAEALASLGLTDDAITVYRDALVDLDAHGLAFEAARARLGLANALLRADQPDEAEAALSNAAGEFARLGHHLGTARAAMLHGELLRRRGLLDSAAEKLDLALGAMTRGGGTHAVDLSRLRGRMAAVALDRGELATARTQLDLSMARAAPIGPLRAELLDLSASISRAEGRELASLDDLRAASAEVERLRGALRGSSLRQAWHASRVGIHARLVSALLERSARAGADVDGLMAEAFEVAERARARSLLDLAAGDRARADRSVGDIVARRVAELSALYSRMDELRPRAAATPVDDWAQRVGELERALADAERRHAARTGFASPYADTANLSQIQSLLPPRTAVLSYFVTDDGVTAFVVAHDGVAAHRRIASTEAIVDALDDLEFHVARSVQRVAEGGVSADATRDDFDGALRQLGRLLVDPLELPVDIDDLRIVPHTALHRVPFPALRIASGHLVERASVSIAPSASLLRLRGAAGGRTNAGSAAECHLLVGVEDELAPGIGEEVGRLSRRLPTARCLVGAAATRGAVLDALVTGAGRPGRVVHFACHGRFSSAHPMASGLRLADGWLTLRDLDGIDLGGAVVTLSACETGRASVGDADDVIGLLHTLLAAGASAVLMSQWMTHDESSISIMDSIYEVWHTCGDGSAAGFRRAVRTVQCESIKIGLHPVFWTPFVIGAL